MSLFACEGSYRPWKVGFCLASTARIAFHASSWLEVAGLESMSASRLARNLRAR